MSRAPSHLGSHQIRPSFETANLQFSAALVAGQFRDLCTFSLAIDASVATRRKAGLVHIRIREPREPPRSTELSRHRNRSMFAADVLRVTRQIVAPRRSSA